jgi:hypothetical protein
MLFQARCAHHNNAPRNCRKPATEADAKGVDFAVSHERPANRLAQNEDECLRNLQWKYLCDIFACLKTPEVDGKDRRDAHQWCSLHVQASMSHAAHTARCSYHPFVKTPNAFVPDSFLQAVKHALVHAIGCSLEANLHALYGIVRVELHILLHTVSQYWKETGNGADLCGVKWMAHKNKAHTASTAGKKCFESFHYCVR